MIAATLTASRPRAVRHDAARIRATACGTAGRGDAEEARPESFIADSIQSGTDTGLRAAVRRLLCERRRGIGSGVGFTADPPPPPADPFGCGTAASQLRRARRIPDCRASRAPHGVADCGGVLLTASSSDGTFFWISIGACSSGLTSSCPPIRARPAPPSSASQLRNSDFEEAERFDAAGLVRSLPLDPVLAIAAREACTFPRLDSCRNRLSQRRTNSRADLPARLEAEAAAADERLHRRDRLLDTARLLQTPVSTSSSSRSLRSAGLVA